MRLGKLFGIDVVLHWTTLVLFLMLFNSYSSYLGRTFPDSGNVEVILVSVLVGLGFLLSVLGHEFGHALTGQRFGLDFKEITLHLLGGMAKMTSQVKTAKSEFWVALAGPLFSFLMSFGFFLIGLGCILYTDGVPNILSSALGSLCGVNLMLGIFNLLPAFPLDGGRVFRAGVWHFTKDFLKATKFAVVGGYIFSGLMGTVGLLMCFGFSFPFFGAGVFSGIWMMVISALVVFMAKAELNNAIMKR